MIPLPIADYYHLGYGIVPLIFLAFTRYKTAFMTYLVWGALVFGYNSLLACLIYWLFFELFALIIHFVEWWFSADVS